MPIYFLPAPYCVHDCYCFLRVYRVTVSFLRVRRLIFFAFFNAVRITDSEGVGEETVGSQIYKLADPETDETKYTIGFWRLKSGQRTTSRDLKRVPCLRQLSSTVRQ
jgi:hypothetical protein